MGVTVRQKQPGKGPYYVFTIHKNKRKAKKVGDKKTAEAVAKELRKKLALGDFEVEPAKVEPVNKVPTFEVYADQWQEEYAEVACEFSTSTNYESIIKRHLKPRLGPMKLTEITKQDVKALVLAKLGEGLDVKTIRNIRVCLSSILSSAEEDEIITANPATALGKKTRKLLKGKGKRNVDFLKRGESTKFLDAVFQFFPTFYVFFLLLLRTGVRLGEALALQPGDIDFEGGFLEIRRAITRGRVKPYPKNGKARRVDMSKQLAEALRSHLVQTKRDMLARGWKKRPVWLFYNEQGNPLDPTNLRERVFKPALEKAELRKIRIHDLRHTFASQLIADGRGLVYVRDQMGHSSIQVTADLYGHLVPGANRDAVDGLDDERAPQPPATYPQPEAQKTTKRGQAVSPNPLNLFGCGGRI